MRILMPAGCCTVGRLVFAGARLTRGRDYRPALLHTIGQSKQANAPVVMIGAVNSCQRIWPWINATHRLHVEMHTLPRGGAETAK